MSATDELQLKLLIHLSLERVNSARLRHRLYGQQPMNLDQLGPQPAGDLDQLEISTSRGHRPAMYLNQQGLQSTGDLDQLSTSTSWDLNQLETLISWGP